MKAKIFCLFFLIVLEFIVCPQNGWTQDNTIPMIGAYYFDGWSGKIILKNYGHKKPLLI